jgi:tRNA (mo5U34)-methyltransferase
MVAAEVPQAAVDQVRSMLRRGQPDAGDGRAPGDELVVAEKVPELHIKRRSAVRALDFLRSPEGETFALPPVANVPAGQEELAREVETIPWYHTMELPGGVVTPGTLDHRPLVPVYGLPGDLSGKTAMDVGTFNGFWAFELEKRGARVTAVDIAGISQSDLPPQAKAQLKEEGLDPDTSAGFELCHRLYGSKVKRVLSTIYDLSPESVGVHDFVHVGDLLVHLEDPIAALRSVRSVTGERAHIVTEFLPNLAGEGAPRMQYEGGWEGVVWWRFSLDALAQMVLDAGFRDVSLRTMYQLRRTFLPGGGWRAVLVGEA